MADLFHGRLFRIFAAAVLLFGVAALSIDAPHLILVSNGLLLAVASGVVISYAPIVFSALSARRPTRGDILGLGIFVSWLAQLMLRSISIIARNFGHPEIVNSNWVSTATSLSLMAGMLHLSAAQAVEGSVPAKRWVRTGIVVAVGVTIVLALLSMRRAGYAPPGSFRPL